MQQNQNKQMGTAQGYENELNAHIKRERAAVVLASKTGELLYDKGIELVLFRNHLSDVTISEMRGVLLLPKFTIVIIVSSPISFQKKT